MTAPCFEPQPAPAARRTGVSRLRASWREWWSPSYFRTGPEWLQYLWTFLFNTAIAVVLTLIAWSFAQRTGLLQLFRWNWVIAQSIGFSIHLLFHLAGSMIGGARIEAFRMPMRVVFFAGIPIIGCLIGYWIGLRLLGVDVARIIEGAPRVVIGILVVSIIVSTFWYRFTANKARLAEAQAERERERARNVELQRLALDAQLRSLQAQIEPHFLFNTLANVVSLIDSAPDKARGMLERLIDLLRSSLTASRGARTTLAQECALVSAYLDILSIRMGDRLTYEIDIPPDLADFPLPPLTLQPLVENAIKHGLEPKLCGGSVRIGARRSADAVEITIDDDGLGFRDNAGAGVGLANLRERLAALYRDQARLAIEERTPGTCVRVTLPLEQR